jgi:hypothetical protein
LIREGPIPVFIHGIAEYAIGVLFILSPFLFSFDNDLATAVAILVGAAIIVFGIVSDSPVGVMHNIPLAAHVVLDYVLALFLIVSPFVFSFTEDRGAFAFFVILGVGHLVLTTLTAFDVRTRGLRS